MKNNYRIILTLTFAMFLLQMEAQDPHFSQYMQSPLLQNPSLAGHFNGDFRAGINYRDQWRSISEPFTTIMAYADGRLGRGQNSQFSGGAYVLFDKAGSSLFRQTMAGVDFAAAIKISEHSTLSAGLSAGIFNQSVDPNALIWDSQYDGMQYDPSLPTNEAFSAISITKPDFSAGINYYFNQGSSNPFLNDGFRMDLGLAYHHVNRPEGISTIWDEKLYGKLVANANFSIGLGGSNTALQPGLLLMIQGKSQMIMPGLMIRYLLKEQSRYTGFVKSVAFSLGGHYRVGDAIVLAALMEFANYAIGFSYDVNASGLTKASSSVGALEFSLRFMTPAPNKARINNPMFN